MPITLVMNKAFLLITLLGTIGTSYASELKFVFPNGTEISIQPENTSLTHHSSKKEITKADRALSKQLTDADEAYVLSHDTFPLKNQQAFTAVIRIPSPSKSPEGFCGAGYEDYVLLIGIKGNTAKLKDRILVQSCTNNISLVSDNGDDPKNCITPLKHPQIAEIESMSPPNFEIKKQRIILIGNKMKMIDYQTDH